MLKLEEITQEQGFDILADILVPIINIAEDETAREFFTREGLKEGETVMQAVFRRIKVSLPALIKGHKEDLIAIMAALDGTSVEIYKHKKGFVGLCKDVIDLSKDEALNSLFTSAETKMTPESFGSAMENLEGEA